MARSFCSCFIKNAHNLASLAQFAQFALYAKAQQQNSADLIYIADKSSELQTSAVKNRRQVAVAKLERQAIARLEEERDIEIALASVKKRSKMRLIQEDMETKHLHNVVEKDEGRKAALTEEKKKLQDGEKDAAMLNALKKTLTDKYDELIEDAEKRSRISEWRLQRFERLESGNATSELKALYEKERKEMEEMQLAGGAGGGGGGGGGGNSRGGGGIEPARVEEEAEMAEETEPMEELAPPAVEPPVSSPLANPQTPPRVPSPLPLPEPEPTEAEIISVPVPEPTEAEIIPVPVPVPVLVPVLVPVPVPVSPSPSPSPSPTQQTQPPNYSFFFSTPQTQIEDNDSSANIDIDIDIDVAIYQSITSLIDAHYHLVDKLTAVYFIKSLHILEHFQLLHTLTCGTSLYLSDFSSALHRGISSSSNCVDWRSLTNVKAAHSAATSNNPTIEDSPFSRLFTYVVNGDGDGDDRFKLAFDCDSFSFMRCSYDAPWPISSVLTSFAALPSYNKIQHHLIKHYRVCLVMKDLFFSLKSRNSNGNNNNMRWLNLFRHEAQHLLNCLGHYFSLKLNECWGDLVDGLKLSRISGMRDFCKCYDFYLDSMKLVFFEGKRGELRQVRKFIDELYGVIFKFALGAQERLRASSDEKTVEDFHNAMKAEQEKLKDVSCRLCEALRQASLIFSNPRLEAATEFLRSQLLTL